MYEDPIIKKYLDLIRQHGPKELKGFYVGDPELIPESNLPAVIISKDATEVRKYDNQRDEHAIEFVLTVVTDIRDRAKIENFNLQGVNQLYDIIEGREDETLRLKTTAILDILRRYYDVDNEHNLTTDVATVTRADYGISIDRRAENSLAVEATVRFVAHFIQQHNA